MMELIKHFCRNCGALIPPPAPKKGRGYFCTGECRRKYRSLYQQEWIKKHPKIRRLREKRYYDSHSEEIWARKKESRKRRRKKQEEEVIK